MSIVVGRREERRRRRLKNSPEKVMRVHAEVVHHALEPRFYCLCRIADYANQSSKHMVEGQVGVTAKNRSHEKIVPIYYEAEEIELWSHTTRATIFLCNVTLPWHFFWTRHCALDRGSSSDGREWSATRRTRANLSRRAWFFPARFRAAPRANLDPASRFRARGNRANDFRPVTRAFLAITRGRAITRSIKRVQRLNARLSCNRRVYPACNA